MTDQFGDCRLLITDENTLVTQLQQVGNFIRADVGRYKSSSVRLLLLLYIFFLRAIMALHKLLSIVILGKHLSLCENSHLPFGRSLRQARKTNSSLPNLTMIILSTSNSPSLFFFTMGPRNFKCFFLMLRVSILFLYIMLKT